MLALGIRFAVDFQGWDAAKPCHTELQIHVSISLKSQTKSFRSQIFLTIMD
jgi:hypothetical protein